MVLLFSLALFSTLFSVGTCRLQATFTLCENIENWNTYTDRQRLAKITALSPLVPQNFVPWLVSPQASIVRPQFTGSQRLFTSYLCAAAFLWGQPTPARLPWLGLCLGFPPLPTFFEGCFVRWIGSG